ncbi:MAG: metal ABC transporter permease [bacterium]
MTPCLAVLPFLPFDWAQYDFMRNALVAVLLVTPLLALLGCLVINNQMAFFSEAMGHSALTGLALGTVLGIADPTVTITGFAVVLAVAMFMLRRYSAVPPDTSIALVMAFVVSLGVVMLSRGGGFSRYSRYLIGDILTVTPGQLGGLAVLAVGVVALWFFLFNAFFFVSLNRSLAASRGLPASFLEVLFSVLVAVVVAVSIPWVGLLVINSMLILPAATARNLASNTRSYVVGSIVVSLLSGILGLICSYYWNTATGATIVLWACGFFAVSLVIRKR